MSRSSTTTEHHRLSRRALLLIFAFWTALALLTVVNRLIDPRGSSFALGSPTRPLVLAFAESWIWAAVTPLIFWLSSRFSSERWHWLWRALGLLVIGILLAMVVDAALDSLRFDILGFPRRRSPGFSPLRGILPLRGFGRLTFLNELVIYMAVVAAGFAREYFLRYQSRQSEAIRLQAEAARLEAQLSEARLESLRMQINPHFLFNTLHAVSALVERDPAGVRRMIARLSDLLRYTLETKEEEVTLDQELRFLERYLDIMKVRFQGKLDVHLKVGSETLQALVPNLILQPIIENAIKHGVSRSDSGGRISIESSREDDRLVVVVRDRGAAADSPRSLNSMVEGIGLSNTRARLRQMYGEEFELSLRGGEDGVEARISLPFHTPDDLRTEGLAEDDPR